MNAAPDSGPGLTEKSWMNLHAAIHPASVVESAGRKEMTRVSSGQGWRQRWKARWQEWEINPVLLKELRQGMRSRAIIVGLMGTMVVQLSVFVLFLMRAALSERLDDYLGLQVWGWQVFILTVASLFLIPFYVGVRLAFERRQDDLDLMFITSLSPHRIIAGKMQAGVYLTFLLFSVCMPFMTLANLLRGVDLFTVVLVLFCLFVAVCFVTECAMLVAVFPISLAARGILGLFLACGVVVLSIVLSAIGSYTAFSGIDIATVTFWATTIVVGALILAVMLFIHAMTISFLIKSPVRSFSHEEIAQQSHDCNPAATVG